MNERRRHYDFIDPSILNILRLVLTQIPEEVVRNESVIPVDVDGAGRLVVAVFDPNNHAVLDKLRSVCSQELKVVVAPKPAIDEAIRRQYPVRWD